MKTKFIPLALLVALAAIMITGGIAASTLAATQTIDNAKKIIIKAGADTFVINVNSIKGDKGDVGATGPQGKTGANSTVPGPQGPAGIQGPRGENSTVPGPQGAAGIQGPRGFNGTSTVIICTNNSTNPLCNPTPPPPPPADKITASDITVNATKNTPATIALKAVDSNASKALTFSAEQAKNGTTSVNGTNAIYTPHTNFTGSDSFKYSASETANHAIVSNNATVSLNVK